MGIHINKDVGVQNTNEALVRVYRARGRSLTHLTLHTFVEPKTKTQRHTYKHNNRHTHTHAHTKADTHKDAHKDSNTNRHTPHTNIHKETGRLVCTHVI